MLVSAVLNRKCRARNRGQALVSLATGLGFDSGAYTDPRETLDGRTEAQGKRWRAEARF